VTASGGGRLAAVLEIRTAGAASSRRGHGARNGRVIEILVPQALTHEMRGEIPAALRRWSACTDIGRTEGYVCIFVHEGSRGAALLEAAARRRLVPDYARQPPGR